MTNLGATSFTLQDQLWFSRLSGDRNPMHIDALAARRTQAGAPVVHGIHGALWALELLARSGKNLEGDLHLRFEAFLYLDLEVRALLRPQPDKTVITLESNGRRISTISLIQPDGAPFRLDPSLSPEETIPEEALDLDFAAASGAGGRIIMHGAIEDYEKAFPALADAIGPARLRAIANLSTLVGMRLPGLHSIFSKCRIALADQADGTDDVLRFAVLRAREPLRQLTIGFAGGGIRGTIEAFVRHPPVVQPSLDDLRKVAEGLDLSGQRALIVGGSRGLGELTAKIAALAGAAVTVTYARGKEEALKLCKELSAHGLSCRARWLDVTKLADAILIPGEFTHIYYFATPAIFSRTMDRYDRERFHTFASFYCDSFEELCSRLRGADRLKAFWPSTTAIDEFPKGMTEYVMAKIAGEVMCRELTRSDAGLEILTTRLPRLPTDQTASVTPARSEDPVAVIRGMIGELA